MTAWQFTRVNHCWDDAPKVGFNESQIETIALLFEMRARCSAERTLI